MQEERRLTLLMISGDNGRRSNLAKQRARADAAVSAIIAAGAAFTDIDSDLLGSNVAKGRALTGKLPAIRQRADAGTLPAFEAYTYFNSVVSLFIGCTELIGRASRTPDTSAELAAAARLLRVAEAMSRGNALNR
ncbi:nitrate- and nitrite sensing domain-containing protein [Nocardia gamkensis]|uniref:nitrate- and nitrite sensing domain-containing protein n=1 Tax=Nocardia gamkensis TaxID=352869 RepID=UPI0037C88FA1